MIPDIYEVTKIGKGSLYVMPRPSYQWLAEEVQYFSSIGVNLVVSHLEKAEAAELGLSDEEAVLCQADIRFVAYPIKDRHLPQDQRYSEFIEEIFQRLLAGENVAVHCRAGIGRTGLTAACLLIRDGFDAQVAIDMVAAARGTQIPDTEEQYDFICDYQPEKT